MKSFPELPSEVTKCLGETADDDLGSKYFGEWGRSGKAVNNPRDF